MRILTWNIHRCFGVDGRYSPERVAEALFESRADVIALQEVDSSLKAHDGDDQLSFFSRALGMKAVMGPTLTRDYGAYGNALLTRFEILSFEEHDLSYRKFEPRGALSVELQIDASHPLRVVNTHLGLKYWERVFQIDRLLADLVWRDLRPCVVLGDFNEWFPYSGNNLRLNRAFAKAPRMATFPAHWPRLDLDRIYFSRFGAPAKTEVYRNALTQVASDHLPVIAEVDIR